MDFGKDYYDLFMAGDSEPIPFYMTYPLRDPFLEEAEYDRDLRRLQELYPKDARRIQRIAERECDKMEHDGSMMYDEYPDRLLFRLLCRRILRELVGDNGPDRPGGSDDHPLMQLIEVMLMQEMYKRRCRHRRCRRWY